MSRPLTRSTGAAREWNARSATRAAISAPTPAKPCASVMTTHRPVRRTEPMTVASSKGTIERTSTTSHSMPSSAAADAASRATGTDGP